MPPEFSSRLLEVDDDLALGVAVPQVPDGLGGLAQRVGPVDDRPDLAGLDEVGERLEVLRVLGADERGQRLAGERGKRQGAELTVASAEPSPPVSGPTMTSV